MNQMGNGQGGMAGMDPQMLQMMMMKMQGGMGGMGRGQGGPIQQPMPELMPQVTSAQAPIANLGLGGGPLQSQPGGMPPMQGQGGPIGSMPPGMGLPQGAPLQQTPYSQMGNAMDPNWGNAWQGKPNQNWFQRNQGGIRNAGLAVMQSGLLG